jgi:hypothetical protein
MLNWLFRIVIIVALVGLAAFGYVAYPQWTLSRIDTAMRAGDLATLETLIDWDRVRAGVRADMSALLMKQTQTGGTEGGFAALGSALGGVIVDRMVDGAVSPSRLIELMKDNTGSRDDFVSRFWFTSPTTFIVALRKAEQAGGGELPAQLVMQLTGVTWRVTRLLIDIPGMEALAATGYSLAPPMRTLDPAKAKP